MSIKYYAHFLVDEPEPQPLPDPGIGSTVHRRALHLVTPAAYFLHTMSSDPIARAARIFSASP